VRPGEWKIQACGARAGLVTRRNRNEDMPEPSDLGQRPPVAADNEFGIRQPRPRPKAHSRRERLSAAIFTGVNMVVFTILMGCVLAAGLLYGRGH
jgi:hypothetical protein